MSEFKQLTSVIETLLEHGTVLDGRMLKHVLAQVLRHSFEETRRQVDQLGAEVRQLAREFDCRELDRAEAERFLKSWFGR